MPGSGYTEKLFAGIQPDLQKKLLNSARRLLENDSARAVRAVPDSIPYSELGAFLGAIVSHMFTMRFSYEFNEDPTKCNPPDAVGGIVPFAQLCSITNPLSDQAKNYIEQVIFRCALFVL
ncbi:hypothetical protein AX16_010938 [Volvariella volvacea WC 439]|nr:hypothetical protein AX16_010938 [Volvariella volvacea WC 439]